MKRDPDIIQDDTRLWWEVAEFAGRFQAVLRDHKGFSIVEGHGATEAAAKRAALETLEESARQQDA